MSAARERSLRILFLRRLAEAGLEPRRCGEAFPRFCLAAGAVLRADCFRRSCEGLLSDGLFCDDLAPSFLACGEALELFLPCGEALALFLPCEEALTLFLACGEALALRLPCGEALPRCLACTGIISICLPCEEPLLPCTLCPEARLPAFAACEACSLLSLFCAAGLSVVVLFNGVSSYLISALKNTSVPEYGRVKHYGCLCFTALVIVPRVFGGS